MDESELLRRCIAGDRAAWTSLVREHAGVMHAMVSRVLRRGAGPQPDIEDVVQSVFLKLWEDDRRRLRTFRGGARLGTWLVAIARREAIDRLRGRERRARHAAAHEEQVREAREPPAGPVEVATAAERDGRVHAALATLPPRDRLLLGWAEDGWTYRAVARVLGLRENSIGPLLQRARERLRQALGDDVLYGSTAGAPPTPRHRRP